MRFGLSLICFIAAASCASSSDVHVALLDFGVVPSGSNTQLVLHLQNGGAARRR